MPPLDLAPFVPIDRRCAIAQGEPLLGHGHNAALFAGISGFTPLAATLAAALGRRCGSGIDFVGHFITLRAVFGALAAHNDAKIWAKTP